MKNILFTFGLILLLVNQSIAQSANKDFVIVGAGSKDANLVQVQKRYAHKSDAYQIRETQVSPLKQITKAINGRTVQDLHIYLVNKPGELVFNTVSISSENVNECIESLAKWKSAVKGRVVIHSQVVFTTPAGIELKQQLEKLSGLEFITVR